MLQDDSDGPDAQAGTRRLNWGCGAAGEAGWINSDIREGPGIQYPADILDGLPLEPDSFDYVVSIHALQELAYPDLLAALAELRRVLKPGGVLRLGLPDMEKGFRAYHRGDRDYFEIPDSEVVSLGAKLAVQLTWYGYSRSLFNWEFIQELLLKAGFRSVHRSRFGETGSPHAGIVELDSREDESLFVEAVK
jgi:predicted SAM-dependent methyltransferase